LQGIPAEMQEAAILDGANAWQRFWKITVPMLYPTIMVCTISRMLRGAEGVPGSRRG